MLKSLSSTEYQSGETNHAFLLHSVGNHPAGSEIDYSIVYADYYYIEALTRLQNLEQKGIMLANK
jgi:unsaturated chondroitin disaccharide hydrolase